MVLQLVGSDSLARLMAAAQKQQREKDRPRQPPAPVGAAVSARTGEVPEWAPAE